MALLGPLRQEAFLVDAFSTAIILLQNFLWLFVMNFGRARMKISGDFDIRHFANSGMKPIERPKIYKFIMMACLAWDAEILDCS